MSLKLKYNTWIWFSIKEIAEEIKRNIAALGVLSNINLYWFYDLHFSRFVIYKIFADVLGEMPINFDK